MSSLKIKRSRCCIKSCRHASAFAAKLTIIVLHLCCSFIAILLLTSGLIVSRSSQLSIANHMWVKVRQLPRYAAIVGVDFEVDDAYDVLFLESANTIMVTGVVLLIISVIAIAAALQNSEKFLSIYASAAFAGTAAATAFCIAVIAFPSANAAAVTSLQQKMQQWISSYNTRPVLSSSTATFGDVFIDYLQLTRHCCGWNNSSDFTTLPDTCCQINSTSNLPVNPTCQTGLVTDADYKNGCGELYKNLLNHWLPAASAAGFVLAAGAAAAAVLLCVFKFENDFKKVMLHDAFQ